MCFSNLIWFILKIYSFVFGIHSRISVSSHFFLMIIKKIFHSFYCYIILIHILHCFVQIIIFKLLKTKKKILKTLLHETFIAAADIKRLSATLPSPTSGTKISRRSRSKSPFRSFRWKRGSKADDSFESEGIFIPRILSPVSHIHTYTKHTHSIKWKFTWWL